MRIIESTPEYKVYEDDVYKLYRSDEANYDFNKRDGVALMWGRTVNDDPVKFPSPNILDLEITTKCEGLHEIVNGRVVKKLCPYCYKANGYEGENMSFETFKKIMDILPKSIQQIAFGADSTLKSNPDIWKMMEYCRSVGIIPNVTLAQILDDETADNLAKYCGAVALSDHGDFDIMANAVKMLTDRGMKQVNIHVVLSQETFDSVMNVFEKRLTDPRLEKLNAIVCLSLKQKGRGESFHTLTQDQFNAIVKFAFDNNISMGFDTCSACKVFNIFKDDENIRRSIECCESTLSSCYIGHNGEYFPCSFTEGTPGWESGINVLDCKDSAEFVEKVWNNPRTEEFRQKLLNNHRACPIYEI